MFTIVRSDNRSRVCTIPGVNGMLSEKAHAFTELPLLKRRFAGLDQRNRALLEQLCADEMTFAEILVGFWLDEEAQNSSNFRSKRRRKCKDALDKMLAQGFIGRAGPILQPTAYRSVREDVVRPVWKRLMTWPTPESGTLLQTLAHGMARQVPVEDEVIRATAVAIVPDGRVTSGFPDGCIRVWGLTREGETLSLERQSHIVDALAVTEHGRSVASFGDHGMTLHDLRTGETRFRIHCGMPEWALAVDEDANKLAYSKSAYSVHDWLAGDPRLVSRSADRHIQVMNLESQECTFSSAEAHEKDVSAGAFTPGGRQVLSGSQDATVKVWDLNTGDANLTFRGHSSGVTALLVTPDGREVVSASFDCTVQIWDLVSGRVRLSVHAGHQPLRALAISSDEQRLFGASRDNTVKEWDLRTGELQRALTAHRADLPVSGRTPGGKPINGTYDRGKRQWYCREPDGAGRCECDFVVHSWKTLDAEFLDSEFHDLYCLTPTARALFQPPTP